MMSVLRFRFARKFGKLSTGAKARDCTYTHQCFAAASRAISIRALADCFIFSRPLVCTLPTPQRRVVSERTI